MEYGLRYTVPFKTLSELLCEVRIEVKDYVGKSRELIAGAEPFIINTETNDLLSPIRASGATLSVFGSDYLQDLYSSDPQGIKITLFVGGSVHWVGFMTPDTFSQDFTNPEFIYEVECVAALSTLKYREFDLTDDFVTFWQIVDKAREYAGYSEVYYTNSVRAKSSSYFALRIASANFYDELGEAMTYYEVLEEIAKYAGCCFTPYKNDLYFLDYQAIRSGYVSYTKLSGGVTNLSDLKQVKNYKGTGAKISRIAKKNKAVVNCSLYEIENLLPKFDDEKSLFVLMNELQSTIKEGKNNVTYKGVVRYYKQPKFTFFQYSGGNPSLPFVSENPITNHSQPANTGASFVRTAEYRTDDVPSRLSFTDELQVLKARSYAEWQAGKVLRAGQKVFSMKSEKQVLIHGNVYFCINFQLKFMLSEWTKDGEDVSLPEFNMVQKVSFRVGSWYFNGSGWATSESTFDIPMERSAGKLVGKYFPVKNNNTFDTGIGDLQGYTFKAPGGIIIGDCELTLYAFDRETSFPNSKVTRYNYYKDIKVDYGIPDEQSIYGDWVNKDTKNDVIYENEITGDYIDPADEIDLKICTNSDGKLALSSVLEGNGFSTEIVTDVFGTGRPENILLKRIVDLYDKPRFVIDPALASDAKPWTKFTEPYLNKQYLVAGGEENVKMESTRYNLIEL